MTKEYKDSRVVRPSILSSRIKQLASVMTVLTVGDSPDISYHVLIGVLDVVHTIITKDFSEIPLLHARHLRGLPQCQFARFIQLRCKETDGIVPVFFQGCRYLKCQRSHEVKIRILIQKCKTMEYEENETVMIFKNHTEK